MNSLANVLYLFAGILGLTGLVLIWVPVLGVFLLVIAAGLYVAAGACRREGRRRSAMRQQGGDWFS